MKARGVSQGVQHFCRRVTLTRATKKKLYSNAKATKKHKYDSPQRKQNKHRGEKIQFLFFVLFAFLAARIAVVFLCRLYFLCDSMLDALAYASGFYSRSR
jgi:hypothetical protein